MVRYSWTRWQHCTACTEFIISIAFISNSTCPVSRTGSSKISSGYRNFTFRVNCSKRDGDSLKNSVKLMLPRRLQCLALLYSFNYYFFLLFFFFFFRFTEAARSSLFHFAINTQFSRWMKKEKRKKRKEKEKGRHTFNFRSECELLLRGGRIVHSHLLLAPVKNVISFTAILNAHERDECPNKTGLFQSSLLKRSFTALWMLESQ